MVRIAGSWIVAVAFGLAALAAPGEALADGRSGRGERHIRYDRHGRYGRTVIVLPRRSVRVVVRGSPYYYDRGAFFRRRVYGYVTVPAPVGAVVRELPSQRETIVVNGTTYLCYDGVYYRSGPAGYTVVSIPFANGSEPLVSPAPGREYAKGDAITINVPNKNGSYTPVKLEEVNGTYVGPRGEVYPTRPELQQLKIMYGQ